MADIIDLTLMDPEGRPTVFRFDGVSLEVSGYYVPPPLPSERFYSQGLDLRLEKPNRKGHRYLTFITPGREVFSSGPIAEADLPQLEPLLAALEGAGANLKRK